MSKSYNNYIALDEEEKILRDKIMNMVTDPQRERRNDPGRPEVCSVFNYYSLFSSGQKEEVAAECRSASRGCVDCKKGMVKIIEDFISPKRKIKKELLKKKDYIRDILNQGRKKAKDTASLTLQRAKEAMHFRGIYEDKA